jgi:serine/threonine protein kinase
MVVGTPGYMSPEQVRAAADARTDIFVLGTVMYEMLTGQSLFERDSPSRRCTPCSTSSRRRSRSSSENRPRSRRDRDALHGENARDRFQSARDLAFQLRTMPDVPMTDRRALAAAEHETISETPWLRPHRGTCRCRRRFALYRVNFTAEEKPRTFRQLTFADGLETFPTLAPDGKTFAYVSAQSGNHDIYVQRVDGRTAINITSDSVDDDTEPTFSPDGSQIAFRSERGGGGIFVMGVTGESVRRVTDFGHNPSWSPDGTRVVVSTAATEMRSYLHR